MTPDLYMTIMVKLGLFITLSAIVGITSWKVMDSASKGFLSRMVSYYIVAIMVVIWFMGIGGILAMN